MQIVLSVTPRGPRITAAGLDAAVGKADAGRDGSGIFRETLNGCHKGVNERHCEKGVVVQDEAISAFGLSQGKIIVL
jgi:hypothetical protein